MPDLRPPSAPDIGGADRVRGLMAAALRYIGARGKLFQIETQEAGTHIARVASCGVLAAGALLIAWMLAVPAFVWLLAECVHRPWTHVALALAGAHFLIGLVLLGMAKRRWRRARMFEETLNQFQKDHEWVAPSQSPPQN